MKQRKYFILGITSDLTVRATTFAAISIQYAHILSFASRIWQMDAIESSDEGDTRGPKSRLKYPRGIQRRGLKMT